MKQYRHPDDASTPHGTGGPLRGPAREEFCGSVDKGAGETNEHDYNGFKVVRTTVTFRYL